MNTLNDIFIMKNITIKEAMKRLDKTAEKCLIVINSKSQLLGTLTDGDIRRSILNGIAFSSSINNYYCKNPTYLVLDKFKEKEAIKLLRDKKIDLIPILNTENKVVDYVNWDKLNISSNKIKNINNVKVIIMAGGKGTRLEPFTKVLPKPLIPIHDNQ